MAGSREQILTQLLLMNVQNVERQVAELKNFGVKKFFVDKISARSAQRPKFDEMMNFLRDGDV